MATVHERLTLRIDRAADSAYRDDNQETVEVLETTYLALQKITRRWNVADNPDTLGVGLVRIPCAGQVGVGPVRGLYMEIEPSATAAATGVQIRNDENPTTGTGLYLRAVSATQKGVMLIRNVAVTLVSGPGSQSIVLFNSAAIDVVVHAWLLGDEA